MRKILLGNSDIQVSTQGLGCMGMSEFYGEAEPLNAYQVLKEAISLGVNFFDTADMYAYGENERLLSEILSQHPAREELIIATKCGIVRDKSQPTARHIDNSPEYIKASCDRSTLRLNTHIDLYYLHRVKDDKQSIKLAMQAMAELLSEGKIRAVGLSEVSAENILFAHDCLLTYTQGRQGLSAIQTEYSLLSRDVERNGVLDTCQQLGISFVAYSPICRGLLSGAIQSKDDLVVTDFRQNLPRFNQENLAHNNQFTQALAQLAQANNCTAAQLSLAWLSKHRTNVISIPGTKRIEYLRENVAAAAISLSQSDYQHLTELSDAFIVKGERY
ncbi:aldo/keto reductase [Shewanella denitrificans OS217]|uniref:Aldo/keto reductase n=1 Tax=Shewanella denitrificans (strain OS217 / ATCC BAA-1090 / DSM 15013) TaxID=318161 RepID=Q12JB7_SHEDO|nr:aldo/keto reductase [Shewanella denitrificans]ABE56459.1 aldo/keto reductase [Shewanella denitrificans OS217]